MTNINDDFVVLGRDDVSDYNEDNILPESPASQEEITAWLKPTAYNADGSEYKKHLTSHLDGTGAWLTSTATYKQWHESQAQGLLWIKGIPGSGKSVFAASLANQLAEEETPVVYFFFRQIIDANHSPVSLLRDWLCQILPFSPPLQAKLNSYLKSKRQLESLSIDELWKDLRLALSHQARVYVIADALDEIDGGNDTFLTALAQLGSWRPARVKVLITSRPVNTVETPLRNIAALQIRLEERLVDVDIATYVNYRLHRSAISEEDCTSIRQAVPGRANGLFLYAKLAMDAFLETNADVLKVLRQLPADLNVMYTDLLREHARRSGVSHDLQLHIMQWVTHASRPLRLLELAEMINVTFKDNVNRDLKASKALVRATCGPLVEVLPDETVSVVHHSLTEFLKGSTRTAERLPNGSDYPILRPGPTNVTLAASCLKYLQSGCLNKWTVKPRSDSNDWRNPSHIRNADIKLKSPFVAYASENWYVHAVKATNSGCSAAQLRDIYKELDSFLQPGPSLNAWTDLGCPSLGNDGVTALHVAAYTGLTEYVESLIGRRSMKLDVVDDMTNTPLHYAAENGNAGVVKVLLGHGAVPDMDNHIGLKPLHQASSNNRSGVVKLLLEAGVDPLTPKTKETGVRWCGNAPSSVGHTPLLYACQNGHDEVVAEFLPYLKLEMIHKALSWAAMYGHSKVVGRILQHSEVDADSLNLGDTPLFSACRALDLGTIEVLLKAGADPNKRCQNSHDEFGSRGCVVLDFGEPETELHKRGYTPMHAFAGLSTHRDKSANSSDRGAIFKLLVQHGGDINQVDRDGNTPLHYACSQDPYSMSEDNLPLAQLFLEAGADPNVVSDCSGETPLHRSMKDQTGAITRLLIERGKADINKQDSRGRTPLLCNLEAHGIESSLRFLQYRPDCSLADTEGNGPLHTVMKNFYSTFGQNEYTKEDLIKALGAGGADPNLQNAKGQTAMHVHHHDNVALFPAILGIGGDIGIQDHEGRTVLFDVVSGRSTKKHANIQLLIDLKASIECRDFHGRTLLHEAIKVDDMATFRLLLSKGVSCTVDYEGNSILHELAYASVKRSYYNDKHVELLEQIKEVVSYGQNANQKSNAGRTPLHIISAAVPSSISANCTQPIDVWLKVCTDVNTSDHRGVTPLHLASARCHYNVGRLLMASADVHAMTHDEGLTPLHIAARCRQPNIVGMLLDHMRTATEMLTAANKKDKAGCIALHYACVSGRHETVALLINVGADVNAADISGYSPLSACADFEVEQDLWRRHGLCGFWNSVVLPSPTPTFSEEAISNHYRKLSPFDTAHYAQTEGDTVRIEEIIDLLVTHGADVKTKVRWGSNVLTNAIYKNFNRAHEYTANCFLDLKDKVQGDLETSARSEFDELHMRYTTAAGERALEDSHSLKPGSDNGHLLLQLLQRRRFHLVERMVNAGVKLPYPSHGGETNLHPLAKDGYARLLAMFCDLGDRSSFGDETVGEQEETSEETIGGYRDETIKPILLTACERELPNMDVVRVLVEQYQTDLNAQHYTRIYKNGYRMVYSDCALHTLAYGKQWWHVAQALPYLLGAGADTEVRNEDGCTPLHVALARSRAGYFHEHAVRVLIEHGADVNAIDDSGQSCLAKAGGDCGLIRLLIQHGAEVTPSSILAAIDSRSCDALKALLSQGLDPNQRRPMLPIKDDEDDQVLPDEDRLRQAMWDDGMDDHEWYPLHYAAVQYRGKGSSGSKDASRKEHRHLTAELTRVLLDYGADPYRTFRRRLVSSDSLSVAEQELEECTVLHEIVLDGGVVEPFLESICFNPHAIDSKGRTLFLAACASRKGPDRKVNIFNGRGELDKDNAPSLTTILLERGADICAKTHEGRNALHLLLDRETRSREKNDETIKTLLSRAPHLINEQNVLGETPFHEAFKLGKCSIISQLLDAGANTQMLDKEGNNALHYLSGKLASGDDKAKDLFKRLLDLKISINSPNKLGETPIFWLIKACPYGNKYSWLDEGLNEEPYKAMLKFYTAAGGSFFDQDNQGQTLLHVVAAKQHNDHCRDNEEDRVTILFKYLMELGLDPMIEDGKQRTSLDVAAACGNSQILQLFERTTG